MKNLYTPRILLVDDDDFILKATKSNLKGIEARVDTLKSGKAAVETLKENPNSYALALIDYLFTNEDGDIIYTGDTIAKELKALAPDLTVIIMSGDKSENALKSWLAAGVDNFVYKPVSKEHLVILAENALEKFRSNRSALNEESLNSENTDVQVIKNVGMAGISRSLTKTAKDIIKFAKSELPVLLLGETGTGKELAAKALHDHSKRSGKRFLTVNCSAFKSDTALLESELFGHEKGSFTGAISRKIGILEEADGGTVFLDEIHHLSQEAQAKILRAIQEKKIRRVGLNSEIPIDFRLISASKPNLRELSEKGDFLPDLYFRIATLDITIAPLRERDEDIPSLVFHFKNKIEQRDHIFKEITEAALNKLKAYNWPGNVRELQNLIEKVFLVTEGRIIKPNDLEGHLFFKKEISTPLDHECQTLKDLDTWYENKKLKMIINHLIKAGHNVSKTAEMLGEKRSTLSSTMKKFGLLNMSAKQREEHLQKIERS
jgi:DNA-binding NtrC family response regulator